MAERSDAVEEQAVRDRSAVYSVEPDIASTEHSLRGYKRTEVGVIPEDWHCGPLGPQCERVTKGTTPTTLGRRYLKSGVLFIKAESISESGGIIDEKSAFIDEDTHSLLARSALANGDILVSIAGVLGRVGKVKARHVPANTNQALAIIRLSKNTLVLRDFLFWSLKSSAVQSRIRNINVRAAQANISLKDVREFVLPLPPRQEEQRAIATALSDADALIESLDHLIAKKRAIKQAVMQQLLTGQTRLPGFTGEWETKAFAQVLERKNLKSLQIQTADYRDSGTYPVVDQGQEAVVGFTDRHDKVFSCPSTGVIVFGDHTCIVKFVDFDFAVGADGTQVLEAKPGQCTRFYGYQLEYEGVQPTGYNRHFKFLKGKSFPVPEKEEQTAIATVLADMDTEIEALEHRRDKARQIKQGMMQQLLTGRTRLV